MSTFVATSEELRRAGAILKLIDNPSESSTRELVLLGALAGAEMLGRMQAENRWQRRKRDVFMRNYACSSGIIPLARALTLAGYACWMEGSQYHPEVQRLTYGFEKWMVNVINFAEAVRRREISEYVWALFTKPWPSEQP